MNHFSPDDDVEVKAAVEQTFAEDLSLEIVGSGSKRSLGRPMATDGQLDLSKLAGIVDYEPAELVLTARPGTLLADVEALLADADQALAFEPPDYSELLGGDHSGTLGGMIACNLSGPRRIKAGAARDHLLGFKGVTGHGQLFKSGGKVVKNVTGYDLSKLVTGSMGTLAALCEVSIKTLPRPETTWTLVLRDLDDRTALAAMTKAMTSSFEISGAAHLPPSVPARLGFGNAALTALRLEGPGPSVEARFGALAKELGGGDKLEDKGSLTLWPGLRDVAPLTGESNQAVWRLSVPPQAGAKVVAAIREKRDITYYYDWAGGLVWIATADDDDAGADVVRSAIEKHSTAPSGHATLIRAPERVRAGVPVFHPQPAPLEALTKRVKESFDPKGILNPGRMYQGI
ncbi:MAG: glycolate oxidase subunit GlcE [Geminicoccaceae bacterium]